MPGPHTPLPPKQQTPLEQHAEWINLLRPDGPFISARFMAEDFPQGLEVVPTESRARLRQAWAELSVSPEPLCAAWQHLVLTELLGYRGQALREGSQLSRELLAVSDTAPDALLMGPATPGTGTGLAQRMLIYRRPWGTALTRAVKGLPSLAEQAAELCRRRDVPLALLTNGRMWVLVQARPGEPASVAEFDADIWSEEPLLLRAFATLLGVRCAARSLASLFERTAADKSTVTDTLGRQVREAVELLVAEFSRLDREAGGAVLDGIEPRAVYRAALTVMMRVVFLLYGEEQDLLPAADDLYGSSYSVIGLYERLDQQDVLIADRGAAAWPTLLATFRAIHGGSQHPDMRIPAYGGSLFNPAAYPWLEHAAVKVTDRVVYAMLDALIRLKQGKAYERLSYKGLDVEQIGHVYEGLLDHSAVKLEEATLGLRGKLGAEVALADLERWRADGVFEAEVVKVAGMTDKQLSNWLAVTPSAVDLGLLHAACDNDSALAERVRPFLGLLRLDLRNSPCVYPEGSVIVTLVGDRRDQGTHYTPRSLAEEIVQHTLDPLCYAPGAADGIPRQEDGSAPETWHVRTAADLLALKVLDPAMGSGAFLVSACRYMAERVVEAWQRDGLPEVVTGRLSEHVADRDLLLLEARRMVADRCLYGVDIDEMAVELAKLSLWLVTLAKGRPFNFVDHALRSGDSLIGCLTPDQIENFHLDPETGRRLNARLTGDISELTGPLLSQAAQLRREIESFEVIDIRDARAKDTKLKEAEKLTERLRLIADTIVAAKLSTASTKSADAYDGRLAGVADLIGASLSDASSAQEARDMVDDWLRGSKGGPRKAPLKPLHWPLEFPEVFADPARRTYFDAVVGNPPFSGGTQTSARIGTDALSYIGQVLAEGRTAGGRADLVAYFLLRERTLCARGRIGMIATNSISQADTREVGLARAEALGDTIYRAVKSQPWPGGAAVHVTLLWVARGSGQDQLNLDGLPCRVIGSSLTTPARVSGEPHSLAAYAGQAPNGYQVRSSFVLSEPEATVLLADAQNAPVLFPYLINDEVNGRPDARAMRWAIDFDDMVEDEARKYGDVFALLESRVKPTATMKRWWEHHRRRPELRQAIAGLERVLVIGRHSKFGLPAIVAGSQVYADSLVVFCSREVEAMLALITSTWHFNWWTVKGESTLETRLRYTPSDGFDTFPQPELTERIRRAGAELDTFRRQVQLSRQLGMTDLYNLVHDRGNEDSDLEHLRQIHVEIDEAVSEAYLAHPMADRFGWAPLTLGHGFHETKHGLRWTVDPSVQIEMNDRLLELNHAVYDDELRRGLHNKKPAKAVAARRPVPKPYDPDEADTLF